MYEIGGMRKPTLSALLGTGAFADTCVQYEAKLALLDGVLAQLNPIQRKWVYLEPIFGRGALPHEQARFMRVDEEFRDIMVPLESDPHVFRIGLSVERVVPASR